MTRLKRFLAMALIVVMVLPVGTVTGYAVGVEISEPKEPNSTWAKGTTVPTFSFVVTDARATGSGLSNDKIFVDDSAKLKIDASCDFSSGTLKITERINASVQSDTAKYRVEVSNLKHKAAKETAKLKFTVEYKDVEIPATVEYNVPKLASGSGGGETPTPPDDEEVTTTTRYSLKKVSSPKNSGNTTVPATPPRYDIDNITSSSDASIRQNYFADITIKTSLPVGVSGVTEEDIDTDDLGSFVFDGNSTMTLYNTGNGYGEIKFTAIRYTGNGKTLAFRIDNGASYTSDIVVTVSECVTRAEAGSGSTNKPSDDDDDGPSIESETPYVIVNQYGYGGGTVTAGDTFTLSLTFLNTSDTIDVSNMMITLTMPDDLMLTSSSNTFYVPTLETKKSITKSVQVTAKPAAKAQSHNISVSMKYQYIDHRVSARRSAETTENIAIPLVQVDRFQITAVEMPMEVMLEEETSITVSFVNKGRSDVYNLTASIDGNVQNPGQNQNLGNLTTGATGTADFFVTPLEAGQLSGTITIVYEDTNMEEKTATIPYNATVKTMDEMMGGGMFPGGGMIPGEGEMIPGEGEMMPEDGKAKWPVYLIIGAAILIPVAVVGKKVFDKKRREREDADL